MKRAMVFLAEGFEEIEALTVVDLLRRAGVHVDLCAVGESRETVGSHGIRVVADLLLRDVENPRSYDAVITPGGMPGSAHLRDDARVVDILSECYLDSKVIGSICASPIVLGKAGIAANIGGTCYPGFEEEAGFRQYVEDAVVRDRNVVTAIGPAAAFLFALELVEVLVGKEKADALRTGTQLHRIG